MACSLQSAVISFEFILRSRRLPIYCKGVAVLLLAFTVHLIPVQLCPASTSICRFLVYYFCNDDASQSSFDILESYIGILFYVWNWLKIVLNWTTPGCVKRVLRVLRVLHVFRFSALRLAMALTVLIARACDSRHSKRFSFSRPTWKAHRSGKYETRQISSNRIESNQSGYKIHL